MSNGVAFPVLRTPDADEAVRVGRRLLTLGSLRYAEVWVEAVLPTPGDVLRVREALPDAVFSLEEYGAWNDADPTGLLYGVYGRDLNPDPAFLAEHVPLAATLEDQPLNSVEATFRAAVAGCRGRLNWSGLSWPAVPEEDLVAQYNHAEVTVLFNTPTAGLDEPADAHTVLVHVRRRGMTGYELRHASWLAAQVGLTVIGDPHEE